MAEKKPIIAVDGPAGTGKSTVCKLLAERMGYSYLDTGALYRAFALAVIDAGISPDDDAGIGRLLNSTGIGIRKTAEGMHVLVNERDVTGRIREETVGMTASRLSAVPAVREKLLSVQREAGKDGGVIAEGRDMGTVVFPRAEVKIFLDADPGERARRRYLELAAKGEKADYNAVRADLTARDERDSMRKVAPLRPAQDAIVIDTTALSIDGVVEKIKGIADRVAGKS